MRQTLACELNDELARDLDHPVSGVEDHLGWRVLADIEEQLTVGVPTGETPAAVGRVIDMTWDVRQFDHDQNLCFRSRCVDSIVGTTRSTAAKMSSILAQIRRPLRPREFA